MKENPTRSWDLYFLVSTPRCTGASICGLSSDHLHAMENSTIKEARYELIALIVVPIVIFGLILMLSLQTRKLLASERKSQKLDLISHLDKLTNIANRRSIDNTIDIEWKRALRDKKAISVLMIDVDHFKKYNDNYGRQEGDLCLVEIATSLQNCLKRSTDVVARYGGEEFIVVVPNTEDSESLAEECRYAVESIQIPHQYSNTASVVTNSIGICSRVPESHSGKEKLLRDADRALYHAKNAGRNQIVTYNDEKDLAIGAV